MTFLNPAILWGLLAVSIPIIIHIFNLKKTRKIEFSTLMFLKEIQETKQKRIKLLQLLILLCRIAFIIFLVLMFADPMSKGFLGAVNSKAEASVLIIFDDSFSMSGRTASGTDLDIAKEKCRELLNSMGNGDEVFFVPASKLNNPAYHIPADNINSIRDSIDNIKVSDITKPVRELILKGNIILSQSKYPAKEIYLISDGQSSAFDNITSSSINTFDENTRQTVILTSSRNPNNISIDTINLKTRIFTPNRTVKFSAAVNNRNNFNVTGKSIIFTSGSYMDEKIIDIPAGSKVNVDFSFSPHSSGFISGQVELSGSGISEDEFQNDNKRNIVFYIPEELNLLIAADNETDAGFTELAVKSSEALVTDSLSRHLDFYKIRKTNSINTENPGDYNSVIIINKSNFSREDAVKLKEYIESGGGLILFPGNNSDLQNYNDVLLKELGLPYLPAKINTGTVFEKIDFLHPVFDGMFKSKPSDIKIESPQITELISPQQSYGSQTLINLADGNNFLEEYGLGKGKILIFAVPPDNSWSDFPQKSIFPPLTIRSIQYSAKLPEPVEAITGKEYYLNPDSFEGEIQEDSLFLKSAYGKSFFAGAGNNENIFNIENKINSTGIYEITGKDKKYFMFPANTNPAESAAERIGSEEIAEYFKNNFSAEITVLNYSMPVQKEILEARTGKMLWQYFLIGALIFFGAEYLLAKSILKSGKTAVKK